MSTGAGFKQTIFFGWRVVGAAFVLAIFSWGISFYGPPIFLEVLHRTRGWPIPLVAAAITTHFLAGAVLVANLATLHGKFGVVATIRAGAVLTGLGLLGWSGAQAVWHLFLAALASGAGWALLSGAALNALVAPWFVRRRPAALGMAFNGASVGGILFSPLWVALIGRWGFPLAAATVGVVAALAIWVLSGRYFGRAPATMGLQPDGEARAGGPSIGVDAQWMEPLHRPWRELRFLTLAIAATLALIAQVGLIAHLFSYLAPRLGPQAAGLTMGSVTVFAIAGRLLLGTILPRGADPRLAAAVNVAVQMLGSVILLLAGSAVSALLLGCWLFGIGLGNVTSLPPLIAQAEFRRQDVPRVVALVTAVSQAGYAFAPAGFGLLAAAGGTGAGSWFAAAALIQAGAGAVLLFGRSRSAVMRRAQAMDAGPA